MEIISRFDWKLLTKYIVTGQLYAVDFETNGLDATAPDFKLFGLGVANDNRVFYIDFRSFTEEEIESVLLRLANCELLAHNVLFDASCFFRYLSFFPPFIGDTLILFKMLATEGWFGQRWGLEVAIDDVLGWPENNKATLADLLSYHKLSKSQMFMLADLEPQAFGEYCGNDAEACWQLWHVLKDTCKGSIEPAFKWHVGPYMSQLSLLVEQQFNGIKIDVTSLKRYKLKLELQSVRKRMEFLTHRLVKPYIDKCNSEAIAAHKAKEPGQLTKTGVISKRWDKWNQTLRELEKTPQFNLNSKQQLADLFYGYLYSSFMTEDWKGNKKWNIKVGNQTIEVDATDSGSRAVDKKVLPKLGEPGKILAEYNKILKEIQYVQSCIDKTREDVLYPQFKAHGTVTGRLGGDGGFNLQQQPKTRGYLSCLLARDGKLLLQLDFTAVEPVVLTNASKDITLMKLYGPDAKPNDVYLYVAAHIRSFSEEVRKYYDPDNPTPDTISTAKKQCKKIRSICKTVHLAKQYGAGVGRIKYTLADQGIELSWEQAKEICEDWDSLFAGTKEFEDLLNAEWESKGGYIHNLVYRPIGVDYSKKKDLVNRYCQSSGHDILLLYLMYIKQLRTQRKVNMIPWIVDFHDETIWEVPESEIKQAELILKDALVMLNEQLQLTVPIKGDTLKVRTLADIKCEE